MVNFLAKFISLSDDFGSLKSKPIAGVDVIRPNIQTVPNAVKSS